jgi:hypothetical protein
LDWQTLRKSNNFQQLRRFSFFYGFCPTKFNHKNNNNFLPPWPSKITKSTAGGGEQEIERKREGGEGTAPKLQS